MTDVNINARKARIQFFDFRRVINDGLGEPIVKRTQL